MATSLVSVSRDLINERILALQSALAQEEDLLAESVPEEPTHDRAVVRFRKFEYSWAAMRVFGNYGTRIEARWYVTQDGSRSARQGVPAKTWDELVQWIGERNWDTIEVLS